jgi:hypothetical protein
MTLEKAKMLWGILVYNGGAVPTEEPDFCHYLTTSDRGEYRFRGHFGFGGKLYFDTHSIPRVGMYPEDQTPERLKLAARINKFIKDLMGGE